MQRGYVRERILRVLLNHYKERLTKYRITKEAQANIAWVIKILRRLEKEGSVQGTEVKDYHKIILLWKNWKMTPEKREYMIRDPLELLKKTDMTYALTTYSAENLVQKYLFPSRVDFYIDPDDLAKWHKLLSENGLVGKGNVRVLMTDKHVFYNAIVKEGLSIVSIPQLIVDLLTEGAVAAEAADMLLEKEEKDIVSRQ
ncbi:hypothetical protein [Candidatus Nitrosotalea okcheonensis]|uniref:Uncharacterized protein n=1 Tax=Candidatus Nitrosotalea okcheonensis TaxID=1903276 RepID=A0A2H1FIL4_9ARCH|nr:hypothetical protein [Candidatus Nitrosotalea okcheonensis]SMH72587.1 conserved protein of unknown function [Candidatus Nitrosotalea okcheonensis]